MIRLVISLILLLAAPLPAPAAPARYLLDPAGSSVTFTYRLNGAARSGTMPVASADLVLDLGDVAASRVAVTLDARGARTGLIFATDAMRGPGVLDVANHPRIRFRATRIRGDLNAAAVTGDLTIRGVTRPVTLQARLYRQRGTAPDDRRNLQVLLEGTISRAAFGARGHADLVGDAIGLRIVAKIHR